MLKIKKGFTWIQLLAKKLQARRIAKAADSHTSVAENENALGIKHRAPKCLEQAARWQKSMFPRKVFAANIYLEENLPILISNANIDNIGSFIKKCPCFTGADNPALTKCYIRRIFLSEDIAQINNIFNEFRANGKSSLSSQLKVETAGYNRIAGLITVTGLEKLSLKQAAAEMKAYPRDTTIWRKYAEWCIKLADKSFEDATSYDRIKESEELRPEMYQNEDFSPDELNRKIEFVDKLHYKTIDHGQTAYLCQKARETGNQELIFRADKLQFNIWRDYIDVVKSNGSTNLLHNTGGSIIDLVNTEMTKSMNYEIVKYLEEACESAFKHFFTLDNDECFYYAKFIYKHTKVRSTRIAAKRAMCNGACCFDDFNDLRSMFPDDSTVVECWEEFIRNILKGKDFVNIKAAIKQCDKFRSPLIDEALRCLTERSFNDFKKADTLLKAFSAISDCPIGSNERNTLIRATAALLD